MTSTSRLQQALLPGELSDGGGRRSARDWAVDALVGVVAVALGVFVLADSWTQHGDATAAGDLALGLAALVALWWRRSHPDAVGILTSAASILSGFAGGPALIAGFNVAKRGSRQGIAAVVALAVVAIFAFPLLYPPGDSYLLNLVLGGLLLAVVIGWGLFARVRREHLLALRERAARREAEQRLRVEQAREAERRRIAREMHDVLAHRVSLLSLQAGALEFRPDATAQEVATAAGVIRATARTALEELREVIGVLRDGSPSEAPEAPQPTLGDIASLAAESRAAGMRVTCRIDLAGGQDATPAVGRTAYRIVQEGLTNARKHAPGCAVEIAVTGGEELAVEVVTRRPLGVGVSADPPPGAGAGLTGLGERVVLAGGALEHGLDGAGDFVLRARLPWGT